MLYGAFYFLVSFILFVRFAAPAHQDEVSTTARAGSKSAGILSMDAPQSVPVKNRLGNKVQIAAATSTTSGFGPSTKASIASKYKSFLQLYLLFKTT
jgi:hypothetical protein